MIIKAIRLEDFRQFKGKQNIDISTDEHKNVTLIHAENSVGKTTILNAILWCFFVSVQPSHLSSGLPL